MSKTHFFGPKTLKLRSKTFFSYNDLYKKRFNYFYFNYIFRGSSFSNFGAPLLIAGDLLVVWIT
jgi:hypothetical protein